MEISVLPAAPESKSADLASAFDEFMRLFELFKEQNDARLKEIEKKAGDPLTGDKVARIGDALDQQARA